VSFTNDRMLCFRGLLVGLLLSIEKLCCLFSKQFFILVDCSLRMPVMLKMRSVDGMVIISMGTGYGYANISCSWDHLHSNTFG
jgi:hypothetical protein